LQERFLQHLENMYDEESSEMLSFIEESRAAMRDTASEMRHEQDALKQTGDILGEGPMLEATVLAVEVLQSQAALLLKDSPQCLMIGQCHPNTLMI
jgi:hypothetical protein